MAFFLNEQWKFIEFEDTISENEVFQISNYGRLKSFKKDKKNGIIYKGGSIGGYPALPLRQKSNKKTGKYIHRLVAEYFLPNPDNKTFVIHLDYDKKNNIVQNLAWATKREKELHQFASPNWNYIKNSKLTETKVILLKKKLFNPNRKTRLRILAKQFGVSEMQLHRIKTGENWGHVTDY